MRRPNAIGVMLSGTASVGALGLEEIKASGGMTMVQDPRTAQPDGMPRSAIAGGSADYVLPAEGMADALLAYVHHAAVAATSTTVRRQKAPGPLAAATYSKGGREIELRVRMAKRMAEVAVRDCSGSISAEIAQQMFEPFFSTKLKGPGMGLAISRSILVAHGGRIRVERHSGRRSGTSVIIALPLRPTRRRAAE